MRRTISLAILGLLLASSVPAQSPWNLGLRAGLIMGGPIPTQSNPDSSSGKMAIGPTGGIFVGRRLSERWLLQLGLNYSYKGATYSQLFRNDTMMALEIFPGVVDTVPTYYYGNVHGRMALHYLELPLLAQWRASKWACLEGGVYISAWLGGSDAGDVQIQIGDGVLFPDTSTTFENLQSIRRVDYGVSLGGSFEIGKHLVIGLNGQRSLRGLYKKGFFSRQGLPEVALYHTQVLITVGYKLWKSNSEKGKG